MRLMAGFSSPATYSGRIFACPNHRTVSYFLNPTSPSTSFIRLYASSKPSRVSVSICVSKSSPTVAGGDGVETSTHQQSENVGVSPKLQDGSLNTQVGISAISPSFISAPKLSLSDQAFFLFSFIALTTSVAITSLVIAAVPTLFAMRRAAISLSKLADTAREELPSTMAAIRLSGMEISDLTLELSDLSKEIADGVGKSAQAVQAAEAGVRQIGSIAHQRTMTMIEERASLPVISLQPVVAGAAKKTSHAVGQATKTLLNMISRGDLDSNSED